MSRRHKKILPNFCCSERRERRKMIKKNSAEFLLFGQASSRRRRATKSTLQSGSLRSPFFVHPLEPSSGCILLGAHARLPSACAICTPLYVPPPPGAVPAPQVTMTISDYWRGYEQGRVGRS